MDPDSEGLTGEGVVEGVKVIVGVKDPDSEVLLAGEAVSEGV